MKSNNDVIYSEHKLIIDAIIKRRKQVKLTQIELAKLTGIEQCTISRIESMKIKPSIDTLLKIISKLGMQIKFK